MMLFYFFRRWGREGELDTSLQHTCSLSETHALGLFCAGLPSVDTGDWNNRWACAKSVCSSAGHNPCFFSPHLQGILPFVHKERYTLKERRVENVCQSSKGVVFENHSLEFASSAQRIIYYITCDGKYRSSIPHSHHTTSHFT